MQTLKRDQNATDVPGVLDQKELEQQLRVAGQVAEHRELHVPDHFAQDVQRDVHVLPAQELRSAHVLSTYCLLSYVYS